MGHYKASSSNSRNFKLTQNEKNIGELVYDKWYSFNAEIWMEDGSKFQLEPTGFWDSKIELKADTETLLSFSMGWKGIIIKTFFNTNEATYLLALKGLLSSTFILFDKDNEALMAAKSDFKWSKLNFDYDIETKPTFDDLANKELLLLTVLHCINYYMTMSGAIS